MCVVVCCVCVALRCVCVVCDCVVCLCCLFCGVLWWCGCGCVRLGDVCCGLVYGVLCSRGVELFVLCVLLCLLVWCGVVCCGLRWLECLVCCVCG